MAQSWYICAHALCKAVLPISLTSIKLFLTPSCCATTYQSYQFFQTLFEVRDGLSSAVIAGYACGCTVLNGLNVFWFMKMITALQKRFNEKDTSKAKAHITPHTRADGAAQVLRVKKRG